MNTVMNIVKGIFYATAFPVTCCLALVALNQSQATLHTAFHFIYDGWGPIAKTVFTLIGGIIVLSIIPKKQETNS